MIGSLIRLIVGSRFTVTTLLSALTVGTAVWQFQALRYSGKLAHAEAALATYQAHIATAQAQLTEAQAKVVTKVEVQYRDRIKVIKEKGDTIIKEVPVYVTEQDARRFGVNVGFVRLYNAASLRASLPEPPLSLTDNPLAFRLLSLEKSMLLTPASVGSGESKR